jgi:hypothetical protein
LPQGTVDRQTSKAQKRPAKTVLICTESRYRLLMI